MKEALEQLKEFHRVFNCARQDTPGPVHTDTMRLRKALIHEEVKETFDAMTEYQYDQTEENLIELADGLADICYVVIGTAVAYGIPLDKVFDEVHRSNMAKSELCHRLQDGKCFNSCPFCHGTGRKVKYRDDGKVLKPEGWEPPRIKEILNK